MIDTGKTMVKLVQTLREYKPADLKVARCVAGTRQGSALRCSSLGSHPSSLHPRSLFVKRTPASNGYKPHCEWPPQPRALPSLPPLPCLTVGQNDSHAIQTLALRCPTTLLSATPWTTTSTFVTCG